MKENVTNQTRANQEKEDGQKAGCNSVCDGKKKQRQQITRIHPIPAKTG